MDREADNRKVISYADAVDFAFDALVELDNLPSQIDRLAALIVQSCDHEDAASLASVIDESRSQALSFDALSRAAAILIK